MIHALGAENLIRSWTWPAVRQGKIGSSTNWKASGLSPGFYSQRIKVSLGKVLEAKDCP